MKITKVGEAETFVAAAEWFANPVWIETRANEPQPSRLRAAEAAFSAGARTGWHMHPAGQTLHILDNVAPVDAQDGPVHEVSPGSIVRFVPGGRWHGAGPGWPMTPCAPEHRRGRNSGRAGRTSQRQ